jgi:hypothetical protein
MPVETRDLGQQLSTETSSLTARHKYYTRDSNSKSSLFLQPKRLHSKPGLQGFQATSFLSTKQQPDARRLLDGVGADRSVPARSRPTFVTAHASEPKQSIVVHPTYPVSAAPGACSEGCCGGKMLTNAKVFTMWPLYSHKPYSQQGCGQHGGFPRGRRRERRVVSGECLN